MSKIRFDLVAAHIISWVLDPFLVVIVTLIASHLVQIDQNPGPFVLFLCVAGLPLFFYYLYVEYQHKEKPWQFFINVPRERRNTLLLMATYTFLFNTLIFATQGIVLWQKISIMFVIYAGIMYLANRFLDKASWHAGAFAFSVLYLADKIAIQYALLLILLPVVYWARMKLNRHTWIQLYLGTVIGLIMGLLSWLIS
ncbi:hypothetical protein DOJK_02326 [Patescibacteria group bacterium]|nr:hypothetical protein [Candidatus Dojkabacteria bacterium]CAG1023423.1 hypothetical protein DOJK_02326 [Patescibacteria group bacterium]